MTQFNIRPAQRLFDATVNARTSATGMLNGKFINVTSVQLIQVDQ